MTEQRSSTGNAAALWEISERVSKVIRSYMPEPDGSPDQLWTAADSRIMGLLNDLAHDVYEEIMSDTRAHAQIQRSPTLGSSIDLLIGLSFKYVETLDPNRKYRYYRECGCCGGTDENRDHYKTDITKVVHVNDCPLARDLPILKAIGLASDAATALPSTSLGTESSVRGGSDDR